MLQLVHAVGAIVAWLSNAMFLGYRNWNICWDISWSWSPNDHFHRGTSKEAIIGGQYCVESFKSITQETEKSKSTRWGLYTDSRKGYKSRIKASDIWVGEPGEVVSKKLQNKYAGVFEAQDKPNLSIKVCRDIDGDVLNDFTAERCFEKEYRSQIAINYYQPAIVCDDEELDCFTMDLWYYYGGYKGTGCGTLFDLNNNDLEKEIEEALIFLLNDKQFEK